MLNYTLSLSDMNELEDTEWSRTETSGFGVQECVCVCVWFLEFVCVSFGGGGGPPLSSLLSPPVKLN